MNPILELTAASVHASGKPILGPLDLQVEEGQHMVVLGPSGCGKTTLLRLIAGLAQPASGTLRLNGEVASEGRKILIPCEKRGMGMLFQDGALWPHMTVRKTLEFVLKHAGQPRAGHAARVAELLAWVELEGKDDRKPGTLSGGEAQRLSLARALAANPRVLLLDEPLGPLDAELRTALLARIDKIQRDNNLTLIHVTHDPAESKQYADRTLRMRDGHIESDDTGARA